jgi:hypothetical protein
MAEFVIDGSGVRMCIRHMLNNMITPQEQKQIRLPSHLARLPIHTNSRNSTNDTNEKVMRMPTSNGANARYISV